MKISVFKNGLCHRRELEESKILHWAKLNDYEIIDDYTQADMIFFISCAFNKPHYEAAIAEIENLRPYASKTYVLGCLPAIDPDYDLIGFNIMGLDIDDGMWGVDTIHHTKVNYTSIQDTDCCSNVKILQGCVNNCDYCSISKATKRLISEPLSTIIDKVNRQWAKGNVPLLMGEDAGAWGLDIAKTLPDLMNSLDTGQVDLDNMDVYWFMKYYEHFEIWIKSGFIRRVAIGVQSFSSTLLTKMGRRPFDADLFIQRINSLAAWQVKELGMEYPGFDIHLMVGHPAESDSDYNITFNCMQQLDSNIPFTVFECWIKDQPMHPAASSRRMKLYYRDMSAWACSKCHMKKHECICCDSNSAPDQPRGTLGIHQPYSSTGRNSPHDLPIDNSDIVNSRM